MQHHSSILGHFSITSLLWGQHSKRKTCSYFLLLTRFAGKVAWTGFTYFRAHIDCQSQASLWIPSSALFLPCDQLLASLLTAFKSSSLRHHSPAYWPIVTTFGHLVIFSWKNCPTYSNSPHPIYAQTQLHFLSSWLQYFNHRSLYIIPIGKITNMKTPSMSAQSLPFSIDSHSKTPRAGILKRFVLWVSLAPCGSLKRII